MEPQDLFLIFLVMMTGSILHGSVGLGLGLVAAPFLLMIDPSLVPAPLIASGFFLVLAMTLRERRSIDIPQVSWAVGGCVIGTGSAIVLLTLIPQSAFSLVFGLMLLVAVGLSTVKRAGSSSKGVVFAAGAASGLMGTTTSIGGPPLALAFQNSTGAHLRSTMSVYFVVASTLALIGLAIVDRFGWSDVILAAYLVPGMMVGLYISNFTRHRIRPEFVRRAVLILSAIAGVFILVNYWMGS